MSASDFELPTTLPSSVVEALGSWVRDRFAGAAAAVPTEVAEALANDGLPLCGVLRREGVEVARSFARRDETTTSAARVEALVSDLLADPAAAEAESLELVVCTGARKLDYRKGHRDFRYLNSNIHRGVLGIELEAAGKHVFWSPIDIVVANERIRPRVEAWCRSEGVSPVQLANGDVHAYSNLQLLVPLVESPHPRSGPARPLHRANSIVAPETVDRASVQRLADALGDYLFHHVRDDGYLTYMLDPAEGRDIDGKNNMIRQWMATVAMGRAAAKRPDAEAKYAISHRNIRHNLRHYYRATAELGLIEWDGMVKLGAVALAAIALMEHPQRAEFERPERKLLATVQGLWQPDGSFQTLLKPRNFEHARNFYPGEALLAWAIKLGLEPSDALASRFQTSFRYWRTWHRENLNPAFIPWHTQAYYLEWKRTGNDEYKDFIFEMSDWLLSMQRTEKLMYPEVLGRFYDPEREHFGSPHASSTGVYMEGLIDAWMLAKEVGDEERRERYRAALVRGLRVTMQLCYLEPWQAFYARDPGDCLGGVRTNIYNTRVRCDNVQHCLMGILRLLDRFADEDYRHPPYAGN